MVAICLLSVLSFVTLVCATPAYRDFVLHERRDTIPKGFVQNGAAPKTSILNLRIALTSKDLPGLEKALYDVSTPSSALYGQHLTKEGVNEQHFPKNLKLLTYAL